MTVSIKEKIGQLLMMDFRYWGEDSNQNSLPFTKTNKTINKLFTDYNLGGFILFRENVESNEQTVSLLRDLQSNIKTPLFFGIDQEGGRVNRIKQGTSGCGNMALAASNNPNNAYKMGKLIGDELYSLGINLDFAPVVDVNSNSKNPIIGVRSYSDNPSTVIEYAKNAIQGLSESNIIDCIKHFPGHGDTASDSHLGNVILNKPIDDLEKVELLPFRELSRQSKMIMSAHISVPYLDDTKYKSISTNEELYVPATLSYKIINKLLKQDIGFDGLVVSDAMDMKAIATHFGQIEATKLAILAGIDIVLMPVRVWNEDDVYKLEKLFIELEKEYISNEAFAKAVDSAYKKVIKFKKDQKLDKSYIYELTKDQHITLANNIINSDKHKKTALDIAKQTSTIVKNSGLIPYQLKAQQTIVVLDSDNERAKDFKESIKQLSSEKNLDLNIITKNIDDNQLDSLIENSDLIILVSEALKEDNEIYSYITSINPGKTINIAALTPYDINYIKNVRNYICIYGATSMDQTNYTKTSLKINIEAAIYNIFGLNQFTGKLPVNISAK